MHHPDDVLGGGRGEPPKVCGAPCTIAGGKPKGQPASALAPIDTRRLQL